MCLFFFSFKLVDKGLILSFCIIFQDLSRYLLNNFLFSSDSCFLQPAFSFTSLLSRYPPVSTSLITPLCTNSHAFPLFLPQHLLSFTVWFTCIFLWLLWIPDGLFWTLCSLYQCNKMAFVASICLFECDSQFFESWHWVSIANTAALKTILLYNI